MSQYQAILCWVHTEKGKITEHHSNPLTRLPWETALLMRHTICSGKLLWKDIKLIPQYR